MTDAGRTAVALEVQRLAVSMPAEMAETLAVAIGQMDTANWQYAKALAARALPQPGYQAQVSRVMDAWRSNAPGLLPESVALAVRAAAQTADHLRRLETIDLVWTGPDSQVISLRRTDQALLQLINEASARLTIVSFAVYKAEVIMEAIAQAARRRVNITICLETPDASEGKIAYSTLKALGPEVVQRARIYVWPLEQRPRSPDGRHGSLHAKTAVADGKTLFISSANLTEYAMALNMELGVLIRGGELPAQVESHFERLIERGVLRGSDAAGPAWDRRRN